MSISIDKGKVLDSPADDSVWSGKKPRRESRAGEIPSTA
jgi:hypothetical protein